MINPPYRPSLGWLEHSPASYSPNAGLQYEVFAETEGWRWRLIERDGRVLAAAPRALSRERCLAAVRILQKSTDAPLLLRSGGLSKTTAFDDAIESAA